METKVSVAHYVRALHYGGSPFSVANKPFDRVTHLVDCSRHFFHWKRRDGYSTEFSVETPANSNGPNVVSRALNVVFYA